MRYIRLCVKGDLTLTSAKNDFTQGSILKKLALFMLPILGALVLQAAYGAVDLLVVEDSVPPPDFPRFRQEARY